MFWFIKRKKVFYDPDKCDQIIMKYSGNKDMQILRALSCGVLKPSDIKDYYNLGKPYPSPFIQEYRLINQLDRDDYIIRRFESGSMYSKLAMVELLIKDGIGYIDEHWESA